MKTENDNYATYEMESNKLRLYVGRVERPIFDRLRAEGWQVTPKQDCDFAAVWTPERRLTALELCGEIQDEDTPPAERALQRAERFAGYRDSRLGEAVAGADRFDAGPSAFGFQDRGRAERAAARLDRVAGRAVDAWSKAEYWQARTRGVIANALHLAQPGVRMGRIKELEADERRFMAENRREDEGGWLFHTRQRLAYERAMLEAEGGRAGELEIVPGGWVYAGRQGKAWFQVQKVHKSNVTGRVVSVDIRAPSRVYADSKGNPYGPENPAPVTIHRVEVERASPDTYRAPTQEELAAFEAELKQEKADKKATAPVVIPLVNLTDEDAERLQAVWNVENAGWIARNNGPAPTVLRISQEQYSAASKGTFSRCETVEIIGGGKTSRAGGCNDRPEFPTVAKVRKCFLRVVVIHDKPRKALTAEQWTDPAPALLAELAGKVRELVAACKGVNGWAPKPGTPEGDLMADGIKVGLCFIGSMSQFGLTDKGWEWVKAVESQAVATV